MKRRDFLKELTVLSIAAGGLSLCTSKQRNVIQLGCFNRPWNRFTLERALQGIQSAGFQYVGLFRQNRQHVIKIETAEEDCRMVDELMQRYKLKFQMAFPGLDISKSPEELVDIHRPLMKALQDIGCPLIIVMGTRYEDQYQAFYRVMKRYADTAQEYDIQVVMKPHGGISATGAKCAETVEKIKSDNFRICYDPSNVFRHGGLNPAEDIKDVAEYVTAMCLKDYISEGLSEPIKEVTPGFGEVDWPSIFTTLSRVNFKGPCLIELLAGETPEEIDNEAKRAFNYFSRLI